jgi:hypothetical protein
MLTSSLMMLFTNNRITDVKREGEDDSKASDISRLVGLDSEIFPSTQSILASGHLNS